MSESGNKRAVDPVDTDSVTKRFRISTEKKLSFSDQCEALMYCVYPDAGVDSEVCVRVEDKRVVFPVKENDGPSFDAEMADVLYRMVTRALDEEKRGQEEKNKTTGEQLRDSVSSVGHSAVSRAPVGYGTITVSGKFIKDLKAKVVHRCFQDINNEERFNEVKQCLLKKFLYLKEKVSTNGKASMLPSTTVIRDTRLLDLIYGALECAGFYDDLQKELLGMVGHAFNLEYQRCVQEHKTADGSSGTSIASDEFIKDLKSKVIERCFHGVDTVDRFNEVKQRVSKIFLDLFGDAVACDPVMQSAPKAHNVQHLKLICIALKGAKFSVGS
jgi:hypothetical protein